MHKASNYVAVCLKNRWVLIPLSAFIFMVRLNRFGHARVEIQLAISLLVLMILWPMSKYEHWESPKRPDQKPPGTTPSETAIDPC